MQARLTGARPLGWYYRAARRPNTRRLVVEHGGFLYDADSYADDLPYWTARGQRGSSSSCPTRSTPTTCASPPRRVSTPASSSSPICRTLSTCSTPKAPTRPRMMSVGLHCRLVGPARPRRRRSRASSTTCRATSGSGSAAARHRAALDARPPVPPGGVMTVTLGALDGWTAPLRRRGSARCSSTRPGSPRRPGSAGLRPEADTAEGLAAG